ncbi:MAG TPA: hypothetical protein VJT13_14260, partial [Xanthobacteraceae bacterium]|nr:hypothetical protein [Xanthobacteraceae bacterium]
MRIPMAPESPWLSPSRHAKPPCRKRELLRRASAGITERMETLLMLAGAGFIAGAMNALTGGGSFVSLPAMIAAGLP